MRHFCQAIIARLLVASITTGMASLNHAQASEAPQAAEAATLLYLELVVNEVSLRDLVEVRRDGESLIVTLGDLMQAGLLLEGSPDSQVDANSLPGVTASYDVEGQRLMIQADPDLLPRQTLNSRNRVQPMRAERDAGGVLSYDLYMTGGTEQASSASLWNEVRGFNDFGSISTTGVFRFFEDYKGELNQEYLRYDTYWALEDQESMLQFRAGDLVTGSQVWSRSLRLGGFQISKDFSLQPSLITYPLPDFSGQAVVPSSVDVFINSSQVYSGEVVPGPFDIPSNTVINGLGDAEIVVTDALGRQVSKTISFYVSNELLSEGLFDFSVEGGFLREEYGLSSFTYDTTPVGSATMRYGLTDWLTAEAHVEGSEDVQNAGVGGVVKLGNMGIINTSIAAGRGDDQGLQLGLGYQFSSRNFSIGVQHIERSAGYFDLGRQSGSPLGKRSTQVTGSLNLGNFGTFGAGYFRVEDNERDLSEIVNVSYSPRLWEGVNLYASANADLHDSESMNVSVGLSIPLGSYGNSSVRTRYARDGDLSSTLAYSKSAPITGGLGGGLAGTWGDEKFFQGNLNWKSRFIDTYVGAYGEPSEPVVWGEARGSLVFMDGAVFPTNQISDSFALVSTNGYEDVPVLLENQLVGTTDDNGHLLVPWVQSYNRTNLSIDPVDLPADVSVEETRKTIMAARRSGVRTEFNVALSQSAVVILQDSTGKPLDVGTVVNMDGGEANLYVGWEGRLFLERVEEETTLLVRRNDAADCKVVISYKAAPGTIPTLGPFSCSE
ncbi:fimbria/pilus outer membrane usher protein [Limibacillus halophilus]|uniref:Outer membrane usher protein n=1 Tax=Limibacillus halophilus TaxID=1579333 RepID=A0A839SW40_9PROT|nr:fimbria/pilus outer membrane usher protein [Limibacillus halophilus]MBB3066508.1 outer membrane usher protein [Limibacillus halophilus]